MSWSAYFTAQYSEVESALENVAVSPDSDAPEQVEQVKAAREAALSLIKSGAVVSDPKQDVSVTLSGHANPNHEPQTGYANDTISIAITQAVRSTTDN